MGKPDNKKPNPLEGTQVVSSVATGGGGGVFQARVGALYLANMLTGVDTTFGLQGGRVEELRMEARLTGAHIDDIFCRLKNLSSEWLQFIQCKRGMSAVPSDLEFVDALQAAWRDYLGVEGSPFNRSSDVLVIAVAAATSSATWAAKRICELVRASTDLADFLKKVDSNAFDAQHKRTWNAFITVSKQTLAERYSDLELFSFLRRLRIDIHDLGSATTQELSLVQALLESSQPGGAGERVWDGLFAYVFEQGIQVGTVTPATWKETAKNDLQVLVSGVEARRGLADTVDRLSKGAEHQLSLISTSLPNDVHIPRSDLTARVLGGFDSHQAVVITGSAGAGKSGLMAELAPVLLESGPLFFFRADELDKASLGAVLTLGGMADGLVRLDAVLKSSARPTVIVDSLEKALESQERGALEELLALVQKHSHVRLCVTTRSYGLNALFANFLYRFPLAIVDVPTLTDEDVYVAVAGTSLEPLARAQASLREVLRAPFYIRLALNYVTAGAVLPSKTATDIRFVLWSEKVAPTSGVSAHLSSRRKAAFDEVCYTRTERFAQFVERPADSEAVLALIHDGVLVTDVADRVAPSHDVLEDWALFFRVEREVRAAERDWASLFDKLGTHAGMRRALRSWIAERSASGDEDAFALLEASLSSVNAEIPQLWRDEVAIGLLRSDAVEALIEKLSAGVDFDDARLLQRLTHLLRVACKGPTSIDYFGMEDSPSARELRLRMGMAAPVGKAWDLLTKRVAAAFPKLAPENYPWVAQLAEDALSHDAEWFKPSSRTADVFSMAESFCLKDVSYWSREETIGKRFFGLFCRSCGAAPDRFAASIDSLIARRAEITDGRDFDADARLEFIVDVRHSREPSWFAAEAVWRAFWALYVKDGLRDDADFGMRRWERELGLTQQASHAFFPPSALQGPFRHLLLYSLPISVRRVVDLCNHCARSLADAEPDSLYFVSEEESPNGKQHLHCAEFWTAYRALHVTSYLLNSVLMAFEERLLIEAKANPKLTTKVHELVLDLGESTLTTGMVAGVLTAHPELTTPRLLSAFKCSSFFASDLVRVVQETSALAVRGGHDGLDEARQQERSTSNQLAHRKVSLESLLLKLQFEVPSLREALFETLDQHIASLPEEPTEDDGGWRMALKRMDARGLKLGKPTSDGKHVALEVADLDEDLKLASDRAQLRMEKSNRIAGLRVWAAAVTGRFSTASPSTRDALKSAEDAYKALQRIESEDSDNELAIFGSLDEDVACAICQAWPAEQSEALTWARNLVLERVAAIRDEDSNQVGDWLSGEVQAQTVVGLAAYDPAQKLLPNAIATVATAPVWKVRQATATAVASVLMVQRPALATIVVDGIATLATAFEDASLGPFMHGRDRYIDARSNTSEGLAKAIGDGHRLQRPMPRNLRAIRDWLIAISAASSEQASTWRVDAVLTLVRLVVQAEKRPRGRRGEEESVDYEAKLGLAKLFAAELLSAVDADLVPLFAALEISLDEAPEWSSMVLEEALLESDRLGFKNAAALWRLWDRASPGVFADDVLRRDERWSSKHEKTLAVLLFCSVPWTEGLHNLSLFDARPRFVADALVAVGDTRPGMRCLLRLASGVGRAKATPASLPALRDAFGRAPADVLTDSNNLWNAETICRVAVHEYREALLRDVRLRRATLDILDRLVAAGSSLAFQLRDYLATSPSNSAQAIRLELPLNRTPT